MARQVGFEGYEDFSGAIPRCHSQRCYRFPDRARWLQDISKSGDLGDLYADMVRDVITNIEDTFAGISEGLKATAKAILESAARLHLGLESTTQLHEISPIWPLRA